MKNETLKDEIVKKVFNNPNHLRRISLDELMEAIRGEHRERLKYYSDTEMYPEHVLQYIEIFKGDIELILADEIDFHNYFVYTFHYIIHIYMDCVHTYDVKQFYDDVEWIVRVIPRDPTEIKFTTRDQVNEQFDRDN